MLYSRRIDKKQTEKKMIQFEKYSQIVFFNNKKHYSNFTSLAVGNYLHY